MLYEEPDLSIAPLADWFPTQCPKCKKLWWYRPQDSAKVWCCYSVPLSQEDTKAWMDCWPSRWWRVMYKQAYEQGVSDAQAEAAANTPEGIANRLLEGVKDKHGPGAPFVYHPPEPCEHVYKTKLGRTTRYCRKCGRRPKTENPSKDTKK